MRRKKWSFYVNGLQGHPSRCEHGHIEDFEKVIRKVFPEPGKVLVIGCAEGLEVHKLNEMGYETIGITLGQVNIEYSKLHYPNCDVRIGDLHDLTFDHEAFDYVLSIHSFEHSYAPFIHCLEVNHVLKQGGKWYIALPKYDYEKEDGRISHHHPNVLPAYIHNEIFGATGFIGVTVQEDYAQELFGEEIDEYYANGYLLMKNNQELHTDVRTILEKRKLNYNWGE